LSQELQLSTWYIQIFLAVATPCALYCPYETKLVSTQKTKGKVYFIIALHGLNLISKAA